MKKLPWGLIVSGIMLVLGAATVGVYGYARTSRFVADSPDARPADVAVLLAQAQMLVIGSCVVGVFALALIVAGYVLWAHGK